MRRTHNVTCHNVAVSYFYAKTVHIYHITNSHVEKEGKKGKTKKTLGGRCFQLHSMAAVVWGPAPPSTPHSCVSSVTKNHWFSTEHLKRCTAHAVIVMGCRWGWGVLWWQRHPAVHKVNQTPLMCYNKNIWSRWLHHWLFNETLKKYIIFEDSAFLAV